jgi:hypothetical protein
MVYTNRFHNLDKKDEHYTPKWVFDDLNCIFDLDVAATETNLDHVPAKNKYTENSLERDWTGFVWMNPPYSKASLWIDKFIDHNNGLALLHCSRSKWFSKIWSSADYVAAMPYNLAFDRPDGTKKQIAFQTFIFGYGLQAKTALNNVIWNKIR